jgi:hypothetical protein
MLFQSLYGALAQLGERYTGSVEVSGSIPLCSTKRLKVLVYRYFYRSVDVHLKVAVYFFYAVLTLLSRYLRAMGRFFLWQERTNAERRS